MTRRAWWQRFLVKGVFWRQLLRWAVLNIPAWLEPIVIAWWASFFLLWGPGRRGVMTNLTAIKPGSSSFANFFRTYRVFWNYAWTITDNARYRELQSLPDWEFDGFDNFEHMENREGGSIILTAHMGSYDLGAQLFGETSQRKIIMVRAPEVDPDTRAYEQSLHQRDIERYRIAFNESASEIALDLLESVRNGEVAAIQGDRVTPGVSPYATTLFGRPILLPAGPFALAMTARVPIYPVFVVRRGRRRYRLVARQPIEVVRRGRNRDEDIGIAVAQWTEQLESVIAEWWFQWFTFEPYSEEAA
ncbi:MAG: phosphatidylinositol dimannoside acyltransferase [Acidobacteriota bacterium]|nr:phosphatidylinositol dimannoside acyltransferase [Acidobacteriota bacterium]